MQCRIIIIIVIVIIITTKKLFFLRDDSTFLHYFFWTNSQLAPYLTFRFNFWDNRYQMYKNIRPILVSEHAKLVNEPHHSTFSSALFCKTSRKVNSVCRSQLGKLGGLILRWYRGRRIIFYRRNPLHFSLHLIDFLRYRFSLFSQSDHTC